jgi:hypothetical protein
LLEAVVAVVTPQVIKAVEAVVQVGIYPTQYL